MATPVSSATIQQATRVTLRKEAGENEFGKGICSDGNTVRVAAIRPTSAETMKPIEAPALLDIDKGLC